jgi:CheY-like chemotaxis protein
MDVLLVEDEPLVRASAAEALREVGLDVAEAACAEAALAAADSAADGPPLVLVADLHLGPGMDGLTLGALALRRWPRVGVVYATGHPEALDGRFLGPRERYVVKPFTPAALLRAVRRLMPAATLGWPMLAVAARRVLRAEKTGDAP